jgi:hypothetical protein
MSHEVFRRLIPLATLLGLLLSRSALAQEPKVLLKVRVSTSPYVWAIRDDAQDAPLDYGVAQIVHDRLIGTEWTLFDNGVLRITKNGKPVLDAGFVSRGRSDFWVYVRDEKSLVAGRIISSPEKGLRYSELCWTFFAEDGRSLTTAYAYILLVPAP